MSINQDGVLADYGNFRNYVEIVLPTQRYILLKTELNVAVHDDVSKINN